MDKGTCVVIGAGEGLGLSIARRFGREGHRAALVARNRANLDRLCGILAEEGIEARGFVADASDPAQISAVMTEIDRDFGPVEVLEYSPEPHNPPKNLHQWMPAGMSLEELEQRMRMTCFGAIAASQAVLPGMRERGRGTILITTGGSAVKPVKTLCCVAIPMAAARHFAISLNQELEGSGVYAAIIALSLLIEPGDPYGDPDVLAEKYWQLHLDRSEADVHFTTPVDPYQHHLNDMAKYGIDMPQN